MDDEKEGREKGGGQEVFEELNLRAVMNGWLEYRVVKD